MSRTFVELIVTMRAMPRSTRPFLAATGCVWVMLIVAALIYSRQHPADNWIISAVLPAFAIEAVFYLGTVFRSSREWFTRAIPSRWQAPLLWASALSPYVLYASGSGTFNANACVMLAALTGILAYWFVIAPRRVAYDAGFLVLAATPVILQVFGRIFISPDTQVRGLQILGHLTWIRLAISALLILRQWDPGEFGFWPEAREWRKGILYYMVSIVPIALVALVFRDVRFAPATGEWWRVAALAVGTFFGMLWVVALSEELFFRGVIERFLLRAQQSRIAAVVISALLFGAAHLWFHQFPNWRRTLTATVLGLACGAAYAQTGSVRVPMVTHALVVTTWRIFFRSL